VAAHGDIYAYRLTSPFLRLARLTITHDSTSWASCFDLWYALSPYAVVALLTFVQQPTGGDLVWAHEEMKQLFHGLAEVTVSMLPSS
jgi:hypothetical protein